MLPLYSLSLEQTPDLSDMFVGGDLLFGNMLKKNVLAPSPPPPPPPPMPSIPTPFELQKMIQQFHQMTMNRVPFDSPPQLRKIFVGGLSHDTNDEQLGNFFSQWGPVVDAIVIRDPVTKHSRGFGFVTFVSIFSVETAMNDKPHVLCGKTVDTKRAIPRDQMSSLNNRPVFAEMEPSAPGCKIQLSGITSGLHSVDSLRIYFETFGVLDQVEILRLGTGTGFVTFESKSSADRCLAHNSGLHIVNERRIRVRAFPSKKEDDVKSTDSNYGSSITEEDRSLSESSLEVAANHLDITIKAPRD